MRFFQCFLLGLVVFFNLNAQDLNVKLEGVLNQIISISKQKVERSAQIKQIVDILEPVVDSKYVTKFVLGVNWKNITPQERKEFYDIYKSYLMNAYAGSMLAALSDPSLIFKLEKPAQFNEKQTSVKAVFTTTNAQRQKVNFPCEFRFLNQAEGDAKVVDFLFENISFLQSQRTQFNAIIEKDGFNNLINFLKAKSSGENVKQ
jgi:phospholipid transport system substrate-binding protein